MWKDMRKDLRRVVTISLRQNSCAALWGLLGVLWSQCRREPDVTWSRLCSNLRPCCLCSPQHQWFGAFALQFAKMFRRVSKLVCSPVTTRTGERYCQWHTVMGSYSKIVCSASTFVSACFERNSLITYLRENFSR